MTESLVSPQSALRNLADYYHWEETGRGIRIYLHCGMADRLQAEVLPGKEVGGILVGRAEEDRGKQAAFIDDFIPVPCSYRGGPLYNLSDDETVNLEAALLRIALAGCESPDAPAILGYYRSHLREGLSLSPADLQVIESYFQLPASMFMLVKSAGNKGCTAGFFFWEDGRIQSEFSSLEVALGRTSVPSPPAPLPDLDDYVDKLKALTEDPPADLTELFRKTPLSRSVMAPAAEFKPPAQTGLVWPGFLLRAATIMIATAALVISVMTYLGAPRPPHPEAAPRMAAGSMLGLQVDRTPPDLLVSWNRDAREIAAARRATLSVRDGTVRKSLTLDRTQLARGSYLYSPAGDDIQFRLEVFGADDGSVSQSLRVLLPNGGSPR